MSSILGIDIGATDELAVPRVWRFNWRRLRWEWGFWIYLRGLDGLDEWEFVKL